MCNFNRLLAERVNRGFEFPAVQTDVTHACFRDVAGLAIPVYESAYISTRAVGNSTVERGKLVLENRVFFGVADSAGCLV